MKLERTAAIAEIVSSVAIVVTVVYLASQTRLLGSQTEQLAIQTEQLAIQTEQTNRALFSNSRAQLMSADLQILLQYANSPFAPRDLDLLRSQMPLDRELTDEDVATLGWRNNLLTAMMRIREFSWFQYQDGLLDPSAWEGYAASMVRNIQRDSGVLVWERAKAELDPGFAAEIDARLAAGQ